MEISFNILLLEQDKAILKMIWLREYNLKINWIIGEVKVKNIKG